MEPTSFNVGDLSPAVAPCIALVASMEPTSFNVGDASETASASSSDKALQWSRRLSTSETCGSTTDTTRGASFNGADVFQRRRQPLGMHGREINGLGFNGADVFQRRRLANTPGRAMSACALQWSRRLSTSETPVARLPCTGRRSGFNGADVFQRRRHGATGEGLTSWSKLQWSRRLSTSETFPLV